MSNGRALSGSLEDTVPEKLKTPGLRRTMVEKLASRELENWLRDRDRPQIVADLQFVFPEREAQPEELARFLCYELDPGRAPQHLNEIGVDSLDDLELSPDAPTPERTSRPAWGDGRFGRLESRGSEASVEDLGADQFLEAQRHAAQQLARIEQDVRDYQETLQGQVYDKRLAVLLRLIKERKQLDILNTFLNRVRRNAQESLSKLPGHRWDSREVEPSAEGGRAGDDPVEALDNARAAAEALARRVEDTSLPPMDVGRKRWPYVVAFLLALLIGALSA